MLKKSLLLLTLGLVCTLGTAQSPLGKEGKTFEPINQIKKKPGRKRATRSKKTIRMRIKKKRKSKATTNSSRKPKRPEEE